MPILLSDLIAAVPPAVEAKVRRVRESTRPVVQEALRSECRLVMRTPEEVAQNRSGAKVPIEIEAGHPSVLDNIEFPDDFDRIMLLSRYRGHLEAARDGVARLLKLREQLMKTPDSGKWVQATETDLRSTAEWANTLLKLLDQHDPIQAVLAVRTDFLGVYEYDTGTCFQMSRP
jgi:hypothetical protein